MKRILLCFCLCFTGFLFLGSVNISQVEYYLDTDPGWGLATQVPITPAADINTGFNVNLQNVSDGLHLLYLRAKDETGKWSLLNSKFILKQSSLNTPITYLEYYFDADPGWGLANQVPITPSADINTGFDVNLQNVSDGLHLLYLRAKDETGKWSLLNSKFILKQSSLNTPITYLEYFYDTDPGYHLGTALAFTGSSDILCTESISTNNLSSGLHFLFVRCQDAKGFWSANCSKVVFKGAAGISPITYAEMFVDNDPGQGNGIPVSSRMREENSYLFNFELTDENVPPGMHLLGVRVKNNAGYWSLNEYKFLYLSSYSQPVINSVCWYFSGSGANPEEVYTYALTNPATDITVALEASIVHLQQDGEYQLVIYTTNARGQKSMPEYKFFTADFSPNNVVLTINGTNLNLTWDEILGANRYLVTQKTDPYQAEGTVYTVDGNFITLPIAAKGFFNVKAQRDIRNSFSTAIRSRK